MANSRKKRSTDAPNEVAAAAGDVLQRHVQPGQRVVAALSGGVDSVVLLHVLKHALLDRAALSALHVNHGLSPNAGAWQAFCGKLCLTWGVPLVTTRVSVRADAGDGIEGAARAARHQAFDETDADWVSLAHHSGDQAETMLFNLVRGTGLRGAAAMREASAAKILRPLLNVTRADILGYAQAHELTWVDDESNDDTRFSRNYLRHEVMPLLAARFPAAAPNMAAAARRFGEAMSLLDELAAMDLAGHPAQFPLPLALFAGLSEPRARNLLRYMLVTHGVRLPSQERLTEALRQLLHAGPDRHPAVCFGSQQLYRKCRQICLNTSLAPPPALPPI